MPEFQREMSSLSEQSDEFRDIEMLYKKQIAEMFVEMLGDYRDMIKVSDLKTASYIILTMVEAVIHDTMFHNKGKNKKAVTRELTAMIVNYLF